MLCIDWLVDMKIITINDWIRVKIKSRMTIMMLNHIDNKSKDTLPEAVHSCSQWHAPMWRCSSNLFKYGNNEQEHNNDADLNVWQQSMLILMMMSITRMTNLQRRQRSAPGQRPLFEKPMATQSLWLLAIMINVMVERDCPKFTFSIFTPDPNLHKSQIYTGPIFTQPRLTQIHFRT